MMHKKGRQQLWNYNTFVLWDINACPIPDGYDPRLVGPRIESALKKSGYCGPGPLTIIATGDLTKTPGGDKVLRELASTGIEHSRGKGFQSALFAWTDRNPSLVGVSTIMLISGPSQLENTLLSLCCLKGYIILVAYPHPDPDPTPAPDLALALLNSYGVCKEWLWETLLEGEMDSGSAVLPDESPWDFSLDLATHPKSVKHAFSQWQRLVCHHGVNPLNVKPVSPYNDPDSIKEWDSLYNAEIEEYKKEINDVLPMTEVNCDEFETAMMRNALTQDKNTDERTLVMWDINSCPIPDGYDSRLVRPRIESAVKNSGFSGPVTITAIDDLTQTLGDKVLRELSSTGIALKHAHALKHTKPTLLSFYETQVIADVCEWAVDNPYPATVMLISGPSRLKNLSPLIKELQYEGYTILLAYPQRGPTPDTVWLSFQRRVSKEWLWKSVLEGEIYSGSADNKQETIRLVLPDRCPETDECPWTCSVSAQYFEDLTTPLKSVKHAYFRESDLLASHNGVNRFEVKQEPPNDDPDTIKECELLYNADIERRMIQVGLSKEKCLQDKVKEENNEVTQYKEEENNEVMQYKKKKKQKKKKKKKKKKKIMLVLWHINSCPIPHGYDSRLVRPRIESAVKNSGFSGSLTITAFGDLTETPGDNVLRGLSSTGIALKHTYEVKADLNKWADHNSSAATVMFISGPSQLKSSLYPVFHDLHFEGYTILLAYPQRDPAWLNFPLSVSKEWIWKSLLEGEMDLGSADKTTRLVLPDKCGETGESLWSCPVCGIACQWFGDVTTHRNMHIN